MAVIAAIVLTAAVGLARADENGQARHVTLKDELRADLAPVAREGEAWTWHYERDLKSDPADWLDRDVSDHGMRWKGFERAEDRYRNGLYGTHLEWVIEFPCPVASLAASAVVANFADSAVRRAFIEYSLDGHDYIEVAEAEYGAERRALEGVAEIREEDVNRLWVRVRQGARDPNALRGGHVVFQHVEFTATGPARLLSEDEIEAARHRIAQRRERRVEREAELLRSAAIQARAVADFNEALLSGLAVDRAHYYLTGRKPAHWKPRAIADFETRLMEVEQRFLDLFHACFGPTKSPGGNRTPVEPSPDAQRLAADPQALEQAHQRYMSFLDEVRAEARTLRRAPRKRLASLRNAARRDGLIPARFASTPAFVDKPPATLNPDGTSTGLLFGFPHEDRKKPAVAALDMDFIAGTFDKYHTDYPVSPVVEAAGRGLRSQIVVPCAVHGRMWCDIAWFRERRNAPELIRPAARDREWQGQWLWWLDFHHPDVREMLEGHLRTVGERYRGDDRVLFYTHAWEAMRNDGHEGEWGRWETGGRTPAAVRDFRAYLQVKLGSIEQLNEAWQTSYASFDEIEPPVDVHHGPVEERTRLQSALAAGRCPPLYYEFNRFLLDSYADYFAWSYRTLKEADPTTPVSVSPSYGPLDGYLCVGRDSFLWAENACDIYGSEFQSPMEEVFHYSIQRASGRPTGIFEHSYAGPESWSNPAEDVFRAAAMRNLWRMVAWGRTVISLFGFHDTYGGASHNNMAVFESGYNLLRRSAGAIGPVKRRLRSMEDVWLGAPVIAPKIAMLHPPTSRICAWPPETVTRACQGLHDVLHGAQHHYAFVHEEHIISGREDLSAFTVLILPHTTHFPPGLTEAILPWVEGGGVLIINGIAGGFTRYGRDDGALMAALFGDISYQPWSVEGVLGRQSWMLNVTRLRPGVRDVGAGPGEVLLAEYGRGRALLAPALEDLWPGGAAVPGMLELLEQASPRPFRLEGDRLETVARAGNGHWHLTLLNPSSNRPAEARLRLAGRPGLVVDRGIEGGFPVPIRRDEQGHYLDVILAPGEGTVIQFAW